MASWAGKCTIVPEELFNKVVNQEMLAEKIRDGEL